MPKGIVVGIHYPVPRFVYKDFHEFFLLYESYNFPLKLINVAVQNYFSYTYVDEQLLVYVDEQLLVHNFL